MIQWAVVAVYVLAMFLFAGQEASSASNTKIFLTRWLPHLSSSEIGQLVLVARKAGHLLAYGLLTLIVYFAARKTKKLHGAALLFAMAFAFVVALLDEGFQSRLQYRTGTINDVFLDGLGICLTGLGLWINARIKKRNKEVAREDGDNERR